MAKIQQRKINLLRQTKKVLKKILSQINYKKKEKILCLCISYKDNVDDIRESPAVKIINKLKKPLKSSFF